MNGPLWFKPVWLQFFSSSILISNIPVLLHHKCLFQIWAVWLWLCPPWQWVIAPSVPRFEESYIIPTPPPLFTHLSLSTSLYPHIFSHLSLSPFSIYLPLFATLSLPTSLHHAPLFTKLCSSPSNKPPLFTKLSLPTLSYPPLFSYLSIQFLITNLSDIFISILPWHILPSTSFR